MRRPNILVIRALSLISALIYCCLICVTFATAADQSITAQEMALIESRIQFLEQYLERLEPTTSKSKQSKDSYVDYSDVPSEKEDNSGDDINEQFKLIRSDIEKLKKEIGELNARMLGLTADIEHIKSSYSTKKQNKPATQINKTPVPSAK